MGARGGEVLGEFDAAFDGFFFGDGAAAVEADAVKRQRDVLISVSRQPSPMLPGASKISSFGDDERVVDHVADAFVRPAHGEGGIVPELVSPVRALRQLVGFELRVAGADAAGFQLSRGDEILEVELAGFA